MGNSSSVLEAESKLAAAERKSAALVAEKSKLIDQLQLQAQVLELQEKALAHEIKRSTLQLQQKDVALSRAFKQQEIAEGLRRSDAMLAKRLLHAQLRQLGGAMPADGAVFGADDGAKAAAMALSAHSELELRQMIMLQTGELADLKQRTGNAERVALSHRRGELTQELWVPQPSTESYVSITLRSARGHSLGGLRLKPFSPMLGFIYQSGELDQARWGAVGGSLLMLHGVQEWAIRAGVCAQPSANQQVALSFDRNIMSEHHTGLSYSIRTQRDTFTARMFGTLDLDGGSQHRHGLEVVCDM